MPTISRMSWRRSSSLHCAGVSGSGDVDNSSVGDGHCEAAASVACECASAWSAPRSPSDASTPANLTAPKAGDRGRGGGDAKTRVMKKKTDKGVAVIIKYLKETGSTGRAEATRSRWSKRIHSFRSSGLPAAKAIGSSRMQCANETSQTCQWHFVRLTEL